jgi:FkbM family methyltransferase
MVKPDIIVKNFCNTFFKENPITLVDIGASGGLNPNWERFQKSIEVIGFEPDPRAFKILSDAARKGEKYFNIGVHSEKKILDFYLYRKQTNSSFYKPNLDFFRQFPKYERVDVVGVEKIEVDSLDHILSENAQKDVDFLKLDIEGNEFSILQGAKHTLANTVFGIESEVCFARIRHNIPLFSDIDNYLRSYDFELFDLRRTYWKRTIGEKYGNDKGQLVWGDAVYLKNIDAFWNNLQNIEQESARKRKVVKAISICIIYGYFDYALQILERTSGFFQITEYEYLQNQLCSNIRNGRKIPDFRGRGRIASVFYTLAKFIEHPTYAGGDQTLGNL